VTTVEVRPAPPSTSVDWGRLVVVPLFSLLLVANIQAMAAAWSSGPGGAAGVLSLLASGATLVFLGLVIVAYLRREPATATTTSWGERLVSASATFLPFFVLPLLGAGGGAGDNLASLLLIATGMFGAGWAVNSLGRNLSVFPQARRLADGGPYRWVRHPLYTAELVALTGVCLHSGQAASLLLVPVMALLQTYRAVAEERLLLCWLPDYLDYRRRTKILIPGVW
jgi:protein-S-isoprenylcysteine O-methyltransferase Ste14